MTFAFLECLGSSSPALESLILDARSCEYIPSTTIKEHIHTPHASFGTNLEPMDGKNDDESPQTDTSDAQGAFSRLMKLHIVGSPPFLGDLILQIASTRLEDVSITVVKKELEVEKKVVQIRLGEKKEMQTVNIAQTGKRMKKRQTQREVEAEAERKREKEVWVLSGMFKSGIHEDELEIRLEELEGESEEERRLRAINYDEQKKVREDNNMPYPALLQLLPTCWSTSLKTISVINTFGQSPQQVFIPPTLLNEAFRLLLFHPTIENLTVEGWTPDSVEDSILGLAEPAPSNLESLFLPLDEKRSGISWSTLRHIAITFPKLKSLQCRINPLSLIPKYTGPTTEVLSHGLRTLSVGNSFPDLHSNELYRIVRYLDLLFPHLEMITTFEHNAEAKPWTVVNELVKICQTVRMDERYRASTIQPQTR